MLLFSGTLGVLALFVWIFCIIDAVTAPADKVRFLPKLAWIAIVILLVDIGSIAWLVAGRPWGARRNLGGLLGEARPPRGRPSNPDDDEEFMATLRARAEEQRRRARGDDGDADPSA